MKSFYIQDRGPYFPNSTNSYPLKEFLYTEYIAIEVGYETQISRIQCRLFFAESDFPSFDETILFRKRSQFNKIQ